MDAGSFEAPFPRAEGFRFVRRLGAGGMGVVYEAEDVGRGRRVALKTIRQKDPELLYRLKREFRALADLSHRNLVSLHDLVIEGDTSFFTMELVRGTDFVSWCRGAGGGAQAETKPSLEEIVARIRVVLPQLAEGLRVLHGANKVHRDLKPSNVLVTPEGRVVILDFGLAADTGRGSLDSLDGSSVVSGTAEYMAPEQASGAATAACDMYAVGVLLFEVLTGRLPFTGSLFEVLIEKNRRDAPRPSDVEPGVPKDLDDLCVDLLQRDPDERRAGIEALMRLVDEARPGRAAPAPPPAPDVADTAFAGREREIGSLLEAFDDRRGDRAALVLVVGPSGIGKSTLVREALDRMRRSREDTVALEGRCYERERVPFRAFDGVVDHLAHVWRRLPASEQAAILPREASALPRLFPVLGRVPAVAESPERSAALAPRELRARAIAALRETFQRLADRRPLVVVLDDLQWVDPGTIELLSELLRPPDSPRVLVVLSARQEATPLLEKVASAASASARTIVVGPLDAADAEALARGWLGDAASADLARRVAAEAEGNPYFLTELARHATTGQPTTTESRSAALLDDVLLERVASLDPDSRRLLEIVTLSGEPIDAGLAGKAAKIDPDDLPRRAGELRAARLLRAAAGAGETQLEPYHDRIRRTTLSALEPERTRAHHEALATALEGTDDPERLARHWAGAGQGPRAARYARVAGDRAFATNHFDHAAALYAQALDLGRPEGADRRALLLRLAEALEAAGRCIESGEAYAEASKGAEPADALDARRKAAEQWLVGGDVVRGIATFEEVLRGAGQRLPKTPRRALLALVAERARLRLRGLRWTPREESQIPRDDLFRLDVTLAGALGLGLVDNIRGAVFQTRALRLALATGERRRVGRSLALEAIFRSSQSTKGRERAKGLIDAAHAIAKETGDAYLRVWLGLAESFAAYCANDYPTAIAGLSATEALARSETVGTTWELNNARIFLLQAMRYAGEWRVLAERFDEWLRDARRRGDRFAETMLSRAFNGAWIARGDVVAAKKALEEARWVLPAGGFHIQHWYGLRARAEIALYEGDAAPSFDAELEGLERSMLTRVQTIRTESRWLCGRLAIARGEDGRAVERLARDLERDDVPYATAWGAMLRAGLEPASGPWRRAADLCAAANLGAMAAACRMRAGDVVEASAWMTSHGIVEFARMANVLAPSRDALRR